MTQIRRLIGMLFVAVLATGCLKARLLNPPSSQGTTTLATTSGPGLSAGGGTLHGPGVTLQASFGLTAPAQATGTGVRLKTGP